MRLFELKKSLPYLPKTLKQEVALQYLDTVKIIEKALTKEGLYAPKLREDLVGKYESIEDFGMVSMTYELRISWEDVFESQAEWDWFKEHVLRDRKRKYFPDVVTRTPSALSLVAAIHPTDLEDSVLQDLLARRQFGDFEKKRLPNTKQSANASRIFKDESHKLDGKLLATAWLMSKGLTTKEWREILAPYLSEADFKRCQSAVYRKIQIQMPMKFKLLELFLKSLTSIQRETVSAVYLDNEDRKPLKRIAKELRISLDSLNDRLEGIRKRGAKVVW